MTRSWTDGGGGPTPRADLYVAVRLFYAHQMRLLDGGDFAGFAGTFTRDGAFTPAGDRGVLVGPVAIGEAAAVAAERFDGGQPRHWFDMLTMTESGTAVDTSYYAVVSVTSPAGVTILEPSCLVRDTLVWTDGRLLTRSRAIQRDDLLAGALARDTA